MSPFPVERIANAAGIIRPFIRVRRSRSVRYILCSLAAAIVAATLPACHTVDTNRIPPFPVYVPFQTQADWTVYGCEGACSYRSFIKSERVPANYPWTALCETGFGGVLLCSDIHGNPIAYDLACPVECRQNVRVIVDKELQKARCPKCGSIYEIFTNYGAPAAGPAAEHGYGLARYSVSPGAQSQFRVISR